MNNAELADALHQAMKGQSVRESRSMTRELVETLNSLGADLQGNIAKEIDRFAACANHEGIPEFPTAIQLCCVLSALYEDAAAIIEENNW